eukprot:2946813-Prymnesium_polylepis.1
MPHQHTRGRALIWLSGFGTNCSGLGARWRRASGRLALDIAYALTRARVVGVGRRVAAVQLAQLSVVEEDELCAARVGVALGGACGDARRRALVHLRVLQLGVLAARVDLEGVALAVAA